MTALTLTRALTSLTRNGTGHPRCQEVRFIYVAPTHPLNQTTECGFFSFRLSAHSGSLLAVSKITRTEMLEGDETIKLPTLSRRKHRACAV